MADSTYRFAVVGLGLMGSAAVKYLAREHRCVVGIGPPEPSDYSQHRGVFASHYDSARITRILDTDPIWAAIARRSIERYSSIEADSGIAFFRPAGCMKIIAGDEAGHRYIEANKKIGDELGVDYEQLTDDDLKRLYPRLHFRDNAIALLEKGTGGAIDPRKMLEAQLAIAKKHGAEIIRQTVTSITRQTRGYSIALGETRITADRVLVCAGAFSNFNQLLPAALKMTIHAETQCLAQLDASEQAQLSAIPAMIYFLENQQPPDYVYTVPPTAYPDGNVYFKMGGDREASHTFEALSDVIEWFHSTGGKEAFEYYRQATADLIPGLNAGAWVSKPCVITNTVTGRPYIGKIDDGLYVTTGGCGTAAKSADELGRLGALLTATEETDAAYPSEAFRLIPASEPASATEQRKFKF